MPKPSEQKPAPNTSDWKNTDTAGKLQLIHELGKNSEENPDELISIALEDNDESLRCAAVNYLSDLKTLETLLKQKGPIQDAASLQYHKLLAGSIAGKLNDQERIRIIESLDPKSLKQVALLAKSKAAGTAAIARINDNQDLADLCLFAASVIVRKSAAEKIDDNELIDELIEKTKGKDKTVYKILSERSQPEGSQSATTQPAQEASPEISAKAADNEPETVTLTSEQLAFGKSLHNPITEAESARLLAIGAQLNLTGRHIKNTNNSADTNEEQAFIQLLVAIGKMDGIGDQVDELNNRLTRLGHKNTSQIHKLLTDLNKLKRQLNWPETLPSTPAFAQVLEIEKNLATLASRNTDYQAQLNDATTTLVESLKAALEQGNTAEANQLWDRIQGNINNTSGHINQQLKQQTGEFKAKITELRDWKNFAATEKKKELISQMQHLLESKMSPADKSKHINKMHKEWKILGHSNQNDKLWRQFKKISDQAYEPCKEHFKQQKLLMANNLKQRLAICTDLESYLLAIEESPVNVADLNKLEKKAQDDWKLYAPVENSRIKKLQKRFYGSMDKIRSLKRNAMHENAELKQALVNQAEELVGLVDNNEAMKKAKMLQAEWKNIGSSSFKEDRKKWESFRAACDKIFAKRDDEKNVLQAEIKSAIGEINKIIEALAVILESAEEEFRESRGGFATLQRDFHNAMIPGIRKERNQLLDRFNNAVRKIEARFKKLPDKKMLQTRTSLAEKASLCLLLEKQLLSCNEDADLVKVISEADQTTWDGLSSCGNPQFDDSISGRMQALLNLKSIKELQNLLQDQESIARNKIIELEIRANLESPETDKSLRMQLQLNQLKNNFGKALDHKEQTRRDQEFELDFLCIGPLMDSVRNQLQERMEKALKKLM